MSIRKSYTKTDLDKYVKENDIELIGEYEKVNRDTKIKGKCKTEGCDGEFEKSFRQIVEKGRALCKSCTTKLSLLKSKQTCLKIYGVENPSQSGEIKQRKIETYNKNHPKIESTEEIIEIDINGIQEKFKPIYEILKKNECTTITINNYKKQEKYICNNPNIIDIEYIESDKQGIPFDKII